MYRRVISLRSLLSFCLGFVLFHSPGALRAQESPSPEKLLEKARVVHTAEQNLTLAESLYRQAIERANGDLRARAFLLLGKCLVEKGDTAAAEEAFRAAAEIGGPSGDEARRLYGATRENRVRLEAVAQRLLQNLDDTAMVELVSLGDPVVPLLIERLEDDRLQNHPPDGIAQTLLNIGSRRVVEYVESVLRSNDRLRERILLGALPLTQAPPRVLRAFRLALVDRDPSTVKTVLDQVGRALDTADLVAVLANDDAEVRGAALSLLLKRPIFADEAAMAKVAPHVVASYVEYLRGGSGSPPRLAPEWMRTAAGRRCLYELVREGLEVPVPTIQNAARDGDVFSAEELVEFDAETKGNTRRARVRTLFSEASDADQPSHGWNREAIPSALELVDSDLVASPDRLLAWMISTAEPADAESIAKALGYGDSLIHELLTWLHEHPSESALAPLVAWAKDPEFRRRLAEANPSGARRGVALFVDVVATAAHHNWRSALLDLAEIDLKLFVRPVGDYLADGRAELTLEAEALERWLKLELRGRGGNVTSPLRGLAYRGSYPIKEVHAALDDARSNYFQALLFGRASNGQVVAYDEATRADILTAALAGARRGSAEEVYEALTDGFEADRSELAVPPRLARILCGQVLAASAREESSFTEWVLETPFIDAELRREVLERALREGASYDRVAALHSELIDRSHLELVRAQLSGEESVARAALDSLAGFEDTRLAPIMAEAAAHPDENVRRNLAYSLYQLSGDAALDAILPLAKDRSARVRETVCDLLARSKSERAAEALVEATRDGSNNVRVAAEKALTQLEKYFEHKKRWDGWRRDLARAQGSTIEKLVRQAGVSSRREVRLAAVRALGVVGTADVLPELIALLAESDDEIVAAAKAAIAEVEARLRGGDGKPSGT